MRRAAIAAGVFAFVLVLLALIAGLRALRQVASPNLASLPSIGSPTAPAAPGLETRPASEAGEGFLYGRITTVDGATYEGRLRWGRDEEAFWGDYFNGFKDENRWEAVVPPERLEESRPIEVLGFKLAERTSKVNLGRPFMARFGDIAEIEARGRDIRVTLKSGTVFDLDRFAADDLADGVRVWDGTHGVVDLSERQIRTIELLPTPTPGVAPYRLHGTVRTRQGEFTGFVQWNREQGVGTDTLDGRTPDGELSLRFDTIGSIERDTRDSVVVRLFDGPEIVLADRHEVDRRNRGMYVDDPRYGRVLISWEVFERVDFTLGGSGPAYGDFPPGHAITGTVTTRAGDVLSGRLVYDLDESEITETLDAPSAGVDYTIAFGLIASIVPPGRGEDGIRGARVTLHSGEEVLLEPAGDLGDGNAGLLVFVDGRERPEYLPWADVWKLSFERPPAMYPRGPHGP